MLHFILLPECCSLDQVIQALIHGQDCSVFIQCFMLKAGAVFSDDWSDITSVVLPEEICDCSSPRGHPSPAACSPDILVEGPLVPAGGEGVPLHLHMGQLSVQTKNGLFTSSFWRKEKISGDILIPFYAELFLDGAAASHIECFVSFEFSLNCIISVSAPWCIMAVFFAGSLTILSGLLSEDQFISSGLWSLKGKNCSC